MRVDEGELLEGKVCIACLNDDCVRHKVVEGGGHYVYCAICGRTTRSCDSLADAEESFDWCADPSYAGADTVLLRISDINKWAEMGMLPCKDLHLYDLRNRINGD